MAFSYIDNGMDSEGGDAVFISYFVEINNYAELKSMVPFFSLVVMYFMYTRVEQHC